MNRETTLYLELVNPDRDSGETNHLLKWFYTLILVFHVKSTHFRFYKNKERRQIYRDLDFLN